MVVSSVTQATFLADSVILIRDEILNNITDPISSTRPSGQKFCITKFATRNTTYPIVTVVDRGITEWRRGGFQSTVPVQRLGVEIQVWARNVKERDELSQQILDRLRSRIVTFSTTEKLHDIRVDGTNNVSEPGEQGIQRKIINVSFLEILEA